MYSTVVFLHSILRWVVLALGVVAVARAIRGRSGGVPWTSADAGFNLGFTAALDLQLLVGLVLLLFGPITVLGWHEPDLMWRSRVLRFFTLEHPLAMTAAIVVAHIGRVRIRRRHEPAARHRESVVFVGLALVIILFSIPWPFLPYGRGLLSWTH